MRKYYPLLKFISKVLFIYIGWYFFYKEILGENEFVDRFLTNSEAFFVSNLFTLFGYDNVTYIIKPPDASVLYWGTRKLIGISDSCNGLILFVVFSGFIVSFPSTIKSKLLFIPVGILAIYFFNIIRIFCLALIYIYYPHYLDFNHHYTFTLFVYLDIFLLWMAYVKKFGKPEIIDVSVS